MKLTLDTVCVRHEATASRVIDNEAIVLTPEDSRIYTLNETGTCIWECLQTRRTLAELVERVQKEFDCMREQAVNDVMTFVGHLLDRHLVNVQPSANPAKPEQQD